MTRCLIVDDEPYAVALIEKHLEAYNDIEVMGRCYTVRDAIQFLQHATVDLLFLDIHLPDIDGISFLSSLHYPPAVIFTTAHRQYAIQAFDLGVIDYLLKPISFLRFSKAIDKFRASLSRHPVDRIDEAGEVPVSLKSGIEYFKILPSHILYLQSSKDYVNIITVEKKYMVRDTLKNILLRLPANSFMKIHKSYAVRISNISSVASSYVKLNNIKIPVGPSYIRMLKEKFSL